MWGDYDTSIDWSLNGLSPSPELKIFLQGIEDNVSINANLLLYIESCHILFWKPQLNSDYLLNQQYSFWAMLPLISL